MQEDIDIFIMTSFKIVGGLTVMLKTLFKSRVIQEMWELWLWMDFWMLMEKGISNVHLNTLRVGVVTWYWWLILIHAESEHEMKIETIKFELIYR